ncbi:MAG TPA: tat (twin-arginine translocation) pathway signal sequence, partial [Negativicutes bacterium]|nr:tat (twin-arginine translocation) pathway signal sequence [Negativicutes bacterium]
MMDRRAFIRNAALAGLALSVAGCAKPPAEQAAAPQTAPQAAPPAASPAYDLTVVQGTEPASLLERGFKAIGGIERYVRKGGSVVIKPNFSVPRTPEEAATTNTTIVAALVKM